MSPETATDGPGDRTAPLGVFDSGVGGLTVAAALGRRLGAESILYLGDTARLPYGTKSPDTVLRYTRRTLAFLARRGVKGVVVACNTASALAVPRLEAQPFPVWGVVEAGAEAARTATRSGRVGVVATESTVRSGAYEEALAALDPDLRVISRACPLFVPLVEEGWFDDPITRRVAERYLEPLVEEGIDTLVLGCTHYPLLRPVIEAVVGPGVVLVDSADAVAERVARDLARLDLAAPAGTAARPPRLFATDVAERFGRLAAVILDPEAGLDPAGDRDPASAAPGLELELVDLPAEPTGEIPEPVASAP